MCWPGMAVLAEALAGRGLCSLSLSLAASPSVEFMCCREYKVPQEQ